MGLIGEKIKIGCEEKTIKEWDKFFESDDVIETQRDTEDFNRIYAYYLAVKAYKKQVDKFKPKKK